VENIEPIKMIKVSPCAKGLHKNEYHAMWSPYGNVVERVWHRIDQWWYWWMAVVLWPLKFIHLKAKEQCFQHSTKAIMSRKRF